MFNRSATETKKSEETLVQAQMQAKKASKQLTIVQAEADLEKLRGKLASLKSDLAKSIEKGKIDEDLRKKVVQKAEEINIAELQLEDLRVGENRRKKAVEEEAKTKVKQDLEAIAVALFPEFKKHEQELMNSLKQLLCVLNLYVEYFSTEKVFKPKDKWIKIRRGSPPDLSGPPLPGDGFEHSEVMLSRLPDIIKKGWEVWPLDQDLSVSKDLIEFLQPLPLPEVIENIRPLLEIRLTKNPLWGEDRELLEALEILKRQVEWPRLLD